MISDVTKIDFFLNKWFVITYQKKKKKKCIFFLFVISENTINDFENLQKKKINK